MAFQKNSQYIYRFNYSPNGSDTFKFPSGNLYAAMALLEKLKVNVVTSTASNAPDFQVANALDSVQLIRDKNTLVWNLSGQALALLFTYNNKNGGKAGANNAAIAGTVANGVAGQHFMYCPFAPLDAIKQGEFACDTRKHTYELKVKWKDLTAAGTLFGTIGGTITTTNTDNYLEVELEQLVLKPDPQTGKPDSLTSIAPLMVGYTESKVAIAQANNKFDIDMPNFQSYRGVMLWTTNIPNTLQEIGSSAILNNNIKVMDSQNRVYTDRLATMVQERSSQVLGLGSSINAGLYYVNLISFGSAMDVLVDSPVQDLKLRLDVNATSTPNARPIWITQDAQ